MTRRELIRLLPRNGDDLEAAKRIMALGHPMVVPALTEIVQFMRVAESKVADAFADFIATIEDSAVSTLGQELGRENCWLRHRVFCIILPRWKLESLLRLRNVLTMIATQPDAYDNDLRCVELLAAKGLADLKWLQDWVELKDQRWQERNRHLASAMDTIRKAQHDAPPASVI